MAHANTAPCHSSRTIHAVEKTSDTLTGRAGLSLFVRYLRGIEILAHWETLFGALRKSRKGQPVGEIFKQLLCFFVDGTSRHLRYFDALQKDAGYAAAIESAPQSMLSSHAVKRFFSGLYLARAWLFRRVLHQLFLWRLSVENPDVIVLGVDTMVMDNDEALQREGVAPTYKQVKGFQPLQITWGRYIVDALFRSGDKHSNHGDGAVKSLCRLIEKIRRHYRKEVPIIVRADSGFFDQKIMQVLEKLEVGYVIAGKLYEDIQEFVSWLDDWKSYKNPAQEWVYLEFADRRGSWTKFRRTIFCRPFYDDEQRWLEFARPDSILYTNLGCGQPMDQQLEQVGQQKWLTAEGIMESYHQRGSDELVHRALKDFSSQTLPFQSFPANAAFYYVTLLAFFLYECFKADVCHPVIPVSCYATTFRRRIVDVAGKIVRHGGQTVLKLTGAVWDQLQIQELWRKSGDPPRFAWA